MTTSTSGITLRKYQIECLNALHTYFDHNNVGLVSLPTGAGKTIIFNSFILSNDYKALVIAHRDELLQQAIEKYILIGGKVEDTGIIANGIWNENKYTVASIQTLARNIDKIDGSNYDIVIVDEAHHTMAPSYVKVITRILERNPRIKILGVTATPFRSDNQSLKSFYKDLIYKIDYDELMVLGYLVPVKGYLVELPVHMDGQLKLATNEDGEKDFTDKSITEIFNKDDLNTLIVKRWIDLARGKKTIFYLSSLEHAQALKEKFTEYGIKAEYIDGQIPLEKRREILRKFKNGEIKVITNMNVLTEGFDDPDVECISLVRPTKSLNLYTQIVGRGLRPSLDKTHCLVLDYTGITKQHEIMGISKLFNLEVDKETLKQGVSIGAIEYEIGGKKERALKVLVGDKVEEFVFDGKEALNYVTKVNNAYVLSCGLNGKVVYIEESGFNKYDLFKFEKGKGKKLIKASMPKDVAIVTLISSWKEEYDEFMRTFPRRAKTEAPTDKQIGIIKRYMEAGYLKNIDVTKLDKLDATNIISYTFATFPFIEEKIEREGEVEDGLIEVVKGEEGIKESFSKFLTWLFMKDDSMKMVHIYPQKMIFTLNVDKNGKVYINSESTHDKTLSDIVSSMIWRRYATILVSCYTGNDVVIRGFSVFVTQGKEQGDFNVLYRTLNKINVLAKMKLYNYRDDLPGVSDWIYRGFKTKSNT